VAGANRVRHRSRLDRGLFRALAAVLFVNLGSIASPERYLALGLGLVLL
jgi:hypothetical protein